MKRNWLIHDNTGRYWLVFGGDGSVWCGTGWHLVVLAQYNLVLLGIVELGYYNAFMPVYIEKKWRFGQMSP